MKNYLPRTKSEEYTAKILQNLYADTHGELASFLQFSFQQFCLLPFETPLKKILEEIASQDLLHTKILAKHLVMLGQTPLMQNCDGKFFSTKQIQTETCQQSMILTDIALKEKSIINYKSAILKLNNKKLKNDLLKILKEEEIHLQMLKTLFQQLKAQKFNCKL